jgi:hypothetical protein
MMDETEEFWMGYGAAYDGDPIESNPYYPNTPSGKAWADGWKHYETIDAEDSQD